MADVPDNAPTQCPGTQSSQAGEASACQGCPNQSLCSSGQSKIPLKDREPEIINSIRRRFAGIRYCLLVLSGKGGVGKSSLTTCLARGLSRRCRWWISKVDSTSGHLGDRNRCNNLEGIEDMCYRVGVLDLDLCGPSLPCLFGCLDQKVHQSHTGWSPVYVSDNLAVMSLGFLLPSPDQAIVWRGPRKNALIRQLLTDVCWREQYDVGEEEEDGSTVDFLLIDTPPGTSDEHLSVVQYLQAAYCLTGAIIITTPQEVALSDVRKEIDFCRKVGVPLVGIVENMTEFICPTCKFAGPIFPPTTGGAASLLKSISSISGMSSQTLGDVTGMPVSIIGRLPMDPRLTQILDEGLCPFELADAQQDDSCEEENKRVCNLSPSDAILVAYNSLIDNLLSVLQNHFRPISAIPGRD